MKTECPTILLVEDDSDLLASLRMVFRLAQYEVRFFDNGVEALEFIRRADPEDQLLLITDLFMPRMNGLQLIKAAKEKRPRLPVIAMTGYGSESLLIELFRLGCRDYLDKPFDYDTLMKPVYRTVEQFYTAAQPAGTPNPQEVFASPEGSRP
jgi:two-component system, NtrC family, C4-dicarboxylate transport response regulator DctD